MWSEKKDDRLVIQAIERQNRGDHIGAANLFQRAGNQYRDPREKQQLWQAAERAKRIHYSD